MSLKNKIMVGQEVILAPYGDNVRYSKEPIKGRISKIGRIYFEVCEIYKNGTDGYSTQFKLEDGRQKDTGRGYGADWVLYLSEQDLLDQREKEHLVKVIRMGIGKYGMPNVSLEDLRQIAKLMDADCSANKQV